MMFKFVRFNIYLCLPLAALVMLSAGCKTDKDKKKHPQATVELHIEAPHDGAQDSEMVPILRNHPVYVNVSKDPFVDAADLEQAAVVDDMGGFALRLKFNWRGTQLLQAMSAANKGGRIAVFCTWGPVRWLGAPMIQRQISDGVLTFTPDATREEADLIAKGLNNVVEDLKKSEKF